MNLIEGNLSVALFRRLPLEALLLKERKEDIQILLEGELSCTDQRNQMKAYYGMWVLLFIISGVESKTTCFWICF